MSNMKFFISFFLFFCSVDFLVKRKFTSLVIDDLAHEFQKRFSLLFTNLFVALLTVIFLSITKCSLGS